MIQNAVWGVSFILALLSLIFGVLNCFFGYRIFKILLGIWGFMLGALIAGFVAYILNAPLFLVILAALLGGIIGAVLMVAFYLVGVLVIGAVLGALLGYVLGITLGGTYPAILVVLAVIGGVLAVIFQKLMIILATSFSGSWGIVAGIFSFFGWPLNPIDVFRDPWIIRNAPVRYYIMLLCWVVLGLVGILVQYKVTARKKLEKQSVD